MSTLAPPPIRPTTPPSTPPTAASSSDIKVMVVDDSAVVRGLITRWVGEESGMTIVARHANGKKAVEDVAHSQPDVIVLDVEMPVMDGLMALPLLLKGKPGVKIIMASTLTQRNAEISMKALSLGAIDYIPKPESNSGITTSTGFRRDLIAKLKSLGRRAAPPPAPRAFRAEQRPLAKAAAPLGELSASTRGRAAMTAPKGADARGGGGLRPFARLAPKVLIIGSSTGGPQALVKLFEVIGPTVKSVPVLVTQHMPAAFTSILAKHLGEASGQPCREGQDGEIIKPGHIYVAPGGYHMRLAGSAGAPSLALDQGPEINFCRPAVDPMFASVSKIYGARVLAVILTGMGHDGAKGGGVVVDAGGSLIAQDEATSVVWGMPGAAAAAGVCSAILPLGEIGPKIKVLIK